MVNLGLGFPLAKYGVLLERPTTSNVNINIYASSGAAAQATARKQDHN
jgi:hypothetical protein